MRRVEAGATWSFFDPHTCPGLNECWGDEYAALYERYEAEGLAVRTMPAQDVWHEILRSQVETGASKRPGACGRTRRGCGRCRPWLRIR